jgi:hypothetical protein
MTYPRVSLPARTCAACNKPFTPRRTDQRVCRPACRKRLKQQLDVCREVASYYDQLAQQDKAEETGAAAHDA